MPSGAVPPDSSLPAPKPLAALSRALARLLARRAGIAPPRTPPQHLDHHHHTLLRSPSILASLSPTAPGAHHRHSDSPTLSPSGVGVTGRPPGLLVNHVSSFSFVSPAASPVSASVGSAWSNGLSLPSVRSVLRALGWSHRVSGHPEALRMPVQVVTFHETLKCIAKVVVNVDVSVEHPPCVGYAHEWFAAVLIQKVVRGKMQRLHAAEYAVAMGRKPPGGVARRRRPVLRATVVASRRDVVAEPVRK